MKTAIATTLAALALAAPAAAHAQPTPPLTAAAATTAASTLEAGLADRLPGAPAITYQEGRPRRHGAYTRLITVRFYKSDLGTFEAPYTHIATARITVHRTGDGDHARARWAWRAR